MDLKLLLGFLFCAVICTGRPEEKASESTAAQPSSEDDSDMYMEPLDEDPQSSPTNLQQQQQAESGHWFPSFSRSYETFDHPPSGHSRPVRYNGYPQPEGAYSQRNEPAFQQDVAFNNQPKFDFNTFPKEFQKTTQQRSSDKSASLLGDGNFGVIQGGTFYAEKEGYDSERDLDDFSSYFHNGHGRPSYFYPSNPKPGKKQQQFENFRDFADINSPPERQYSQYVVVYTNKNGTRTSTSVQAEPKEASTEGIRHIEIDAKRPKNILESLALLDSTAPEAKDDLIILTKALLLPSYDQGDVIDIPSEKKLSKSKRKLAKLAPEKKHEARLLQKAKDMKEPLLALS